MLTRRLTVLLVLVGLSFPIMTHAAPPTVIAVKTDTPPTLDGKLDDPVWQQGAWSTNFTMLGEGKKPATAQTRFKVAFNDQNLYFAVECFEPEMSKLVARETTRDGLVFYDDVVEIMVAPRSTRLEYYHFIVNPLGTLYDAERRQGGNVHTVEWNCNWQAKIGKTESSWIVEAAIPFVELGLNGSSKGDWTLNVARERQAGTQELSSCTEGRGGFHQPNLYATLKLPGADLGRYMWTLSPPYEVAIRMEKGKLTYNAKVHLTDETGHFWFVQLRPELINAKQQSSGKAVSAGFDAGQSREIPFSVRVREPGPQTLRLRLMDRRNPKMTLYLKSLQVNISYTPLAIDITQPCYRDSIYATHKLAQVEFTVTSDLSAEELAEKRLTAGLYLQDKEGKLEAKPVFEAMPVKAAPQVKMTLPAGELKVADYQLVVALVNRAGKAVHTAQKRLRKLPPAPGGHEWRIDENNVLLHNGQPFLPFGWYCQPPNEINAADSYTALQSYSQEWFPNDKVRAWLDEVAAKGLFAVFYPYTLQGCWNRDESLKRPLNEQERAGLQQRVTALSDHPAVLAWYMADEPELTPVLPQRSQELYETVRDIDPYHPCIMLNDTMAGIATYERGGDILMPDPYPCFMKGGLAASPIERVSQFMDKIKEATGGRKPAWITPQAFNYGDVNKAGQRAPNFTELRNQNYQAVAHGAKGFLWYIYTDSRNYPDLVYGMPFLAREMRDLKDAVLAPDVADAVAVKAPESEHIHKAVRRVGGDLYLFAVNTATEPQEVLFTLKGAPSAFHVVSEGRKINLTDGSFTDKFATYATHIYCTKESLAGREQIAEVEAQIDKANAARKKPGNLAFEDSGVRVTASSAGGYGSYFERVVDGVTTHMGWTAKDKNKVGDWLQLAWPGEVEIARVVFFTTSIEAADIQVPGEKEGEWKTVCQTAPGAQSLTATFAPVKTKALRILATKLQAGKEYSAIQEVEAYAK